MPAYRAAPAVNKTADADPSERSRSSRTSTTGCPPGRSAQPTNAPSSAIPASSGTSTLAWPIPPSWERFDRPSRIPPAPAPSRPSPIRSRRARPAPGEGRSAGSSRQASTSPTAITGTLTRNSQRQLSQLSITPPITGPRIGPSASGRLTAAIRLLLARPPAALTARVCISGKIRPAAKPCTTRKPIRLASFQATAHRTDPTDEEQQRRHPDPLAAPPASAHPVTGIATAIASR